MKWPGELIRFGVVGILTNAFGFLIYVLFTTLGVTPVLTISIFYPVHIGAAFFLNKKWSFRHQGRLSKSAVRYLISYVGCYVLNVGALKFFYSYLGISHLLVQASAVVVLAALLFMAQKHWVFRGREDPLSDMRVL